MGRNTRDTELRVCSVARSRVDPFLWTDTALLNAHSEGNSSSLPRGIAALTST